MLCVELDKSPRSTARTTTRNVAQDGTDAKGDLEKKYEEQKAKKDDFAIPPDDSQLLKFAEEGVAEGRRESGTWTPRSTSPATTLLVPTSFLDKEKVGERATQPAERRNGDTAWKKELTYNPWGGATVAGDLAVVPAAPSATTTRNCRAQEATSPRWT